MTKEGDLLIVESDIICIYTGELYLAKGQKVIVSKVNYLPYSGKYSRISGCEDIYNPLEIMSICIEENPGINYRPNTFTNCIIKEKRR